MDYAEELLVSVQGGQLEVRQEEAGHVVPLEAVVTADPSGGRNTHM